MNLWFKKYEYSDSVNNIGERVEYWISFGRIFWSKLNLKGNPTITWCQDIRYLLLSDGSNNK